MPLFDGVSLRIRSLRAQVTGSPDAAAVMLASGAAAWNAAVADDSGLVKSLKTWPRGLSKFRVTKIVAA